ncbi:MAG: amidase [Brevundimonas sp.]|uniref:amidase n=1 Tax=Brevundimonas sp. TaxID=1871086 RepID=UPI00391A7DEE
MRKGGVLAALAGLTLAACATSGQPTLEARDRATVNSVIAWSPAADSATWDAGAADRSIIGMPILIKDNIETADMPTTAGSLALVNNAPGRDAPLVARLREAGAVIAGKANLSEWANFRGADSISGWSAVGGQTRNPHALDRNPCGSSSGSAAAVAAGLVPAAIGTETNGSIVCPAAANGVVGFKPTVGLVSRTHIIPISESQDTAGPITRTVEDAALILSVMAGTDPADPATAEADARRTDYRAALDAGSLAGARIGVARFASGYHDGTDAVFEAALADLRAAGAELVEITEGPAMGPIGQAQFTVLLTELKAGLNAYLASTDPTQVPTRTLADLIAFNEATPRELALFGQEYFVHAEATGGLDDPEYVQARDTARRLAGPEGIDRLLAEYDVIALVAPTGGPAWPTDPVMGDRFLGSSSTLAAVAGYPHLTVPMGFVHGLSVGLSIFGGRWDDARILSLGYAYEQQSRAFRAPVFLDSVNDNEAIAPLLRPAASQ